MQAVRYQRVRELLKRQLGEILRREFPAEECLVTVNDVEPAHDLRSAAVYIGILGPKSRATRIIDQLNEQRALIQDRVAHAVVLRHTPRLRFELDESVERGNRVLSILDEIERSNPEPPREAPTEDH